MYGVERSVVTLGSDVGTAEGKAMLDVKGKAGVKGAGTVRLVVGSTVMLLGKSHAVCQTCSSATSQDRKDARHTLFVSTSNLIPNTVFVMLFRRSAVPMPLPPPMLKPQPRFGLFVSPIVFAAALTTVLRLTRSCTAGVATAAGARMMPVTYIVVKSML